MWHISQLVGDEWVEYHIETNYKSTQLISKNNNNNNKMTW